MAVHPLLPASSGGRSAAASQSRAGIRHGQGYQPARRLTIPDPLTIDMPVRRLIEPTTVPGMRDDSIKASLGLKFTTTSGLTIVTNSIGPLNNGGLLPDVMWAVGIRIQLLTGC